ncbi:inositol monophosphatase [Puteibacter caeruleilacunae]|nr:inositol monophosphatase [Puteibacter caeruleilacunae]
MNYQHICNEVVAIAKDVATFIANEKSNFDPAKIENKAKFDYVTYVDKASEEKIIAGLEKLIPESGFIAEEGSSTKHGDKYNWIIDPLDGTTNFIHDLPPHAISIALQEDNEIVIGVVYEITKNECFYSYKGAPVFLNGKEVHTSQTKKVANSLVATGFPPANFSMIDNHMEAMRYFMYNTHGIRRIGSAASNLAYLAAGRFDAFFEHGVKAWDIAAGAFLVRQAGGKTIGINGDEDFLFKEQIVASNSVVFNEFYELVSKFFKQ